MSAGDRRAALSAAISAIQREGAGIAGIRLVPAAGLQALVEDTLAGEPQAAHTLRPLTQLLSDLRAIRQRREHPHCFCRGKPVSTFPTERPCSDAARQKQPPL
jgi:hypothetical protein